MFPGGLLSRNAGQSPSLPPCLHPPRDGHELMETTEVLLTPVLPQTSHHTNQAAATPCLPPPHLGHLQRRGPGHPLQEPDHLHQEQGHPHRELDHLHQEPGHPRQEPGHLLLQGERERLGLQLRKRGGGRSQLKRHGRLGWVAGWWDGWVWAGG